MPTAGPFTETLFSIYVSLRIQLMKLFVKFSLSAEKFCILTEAIAGKGKQHFLHSYAVSVE